jgi:hypothetical protein
MAFFIVPMSFGMRVGGIVGPKQPKTKSIYPPALGDRTPACLIGEELSGIGCLVIGVVG